MGTDSPRFLHDPSSVAVFGASDNPDKVGGRPIHYMATLGYHGRVYPINPSRPEVQGLTAFPDLASLPEVPDVAVVAIGGQTAVDAVAACAAAGVKGCVILAAGFAEAHDEQGRLWQDEMVATAAAAGMRLVGPNAQGLASFDTGAVLSFSTMFTESPPLDGPIAIVSQSGGMCAVPYGLLRERGLGVRYVHGTGNDCDVSTAELIDTVLDDPGIRLVLTYIEGIADTAVFEAAARKALDRDVPIIALVGGRTEAGARAAASHTGSLANDRVVLDALLIKLGVRRVDSVTELVEAADVYLQGGRVRGDELTVVANGGGVCVTSSDHASTYGLRLSTFSDQTLAATTAVLPAFASASNPVDITGVLLTDSSMVRKVLDCLEVGADGDVFMISIPIAGRGYDLEEFASAACDFVVRSEAPVVVVSPQPQVAAVYRRRGLPVYADEAHAIRALAGYVHHDTLRQAARLTGRPRLTPRAEGSTRLLNEADSLAVLETLGEVVQHRLVPDAGSAVAAAAQFDGAVVVKGCTSSVSHKSDHGLVELGLRGPDAVRCASERILSSMGELGFDIDGLLVEEMVRSANEVSVGAHRDPRFGPVVMVGAGGRYVEAVPDFAVLIPPFRRDDAIAAIEGLRMAPVLRGVRGEPALDVTAWADLAVAVGELMADPASDVESLDANPVLLVPTDSGTRAVIADAVVVLRTQ
jgi:acyl-CoA synthetase (NDP forming)